jgi:outer membrane protein assembly factor BamB
MGIFCVDYITKRLFGNNPESSFIGSPAVSSDKVVIGSENQTVYCFNKSDGRLIWKFKTLGKIAGSPVIAGNQTVFASGDGRIYVLDLKTGKQSWSYDMGSPSSSTPAIIKNLMVIATQEGHVFGFNIAEK